MQVQHLDNRRHVPEGKLNSWIVAAQQLHDALRTTTRHSYLQCVTIEEKGRGETLRDYFLRTTRGHNIPRDVNVWEFDREGNLYR